MAASPAYSKFKALKASRKQGGESNEGPSSADQAKAAQASRLQSMTMTPREEGVQLNAEPVVALEAAAAAGDEAALVVKQMSLEERWAAEDAAKAAAAAAAAGKPLGPGAAQPVMAQASELLKAGKVADAREQWEQAMRILIPHETVGNAPDMDGNGDGTTTTFIEIP